MAEIEAGSLIDTVPDIPESVQKIVGHALNKAKVELEKSGLIVPFTAVLIKDQVFIELHPGDSPRECFNLARHSVEGMRGATSYAFCYDGFIDTNQGQKDAIIAEGGVPGSDEGYALAYIYTIDETDDNGNPSSVTVESAHLTYIGEADNFMKGLTEESEYANLGVSFDDDVPSADEA